MIIARRLEFLVCFLVLGIPGVLLAFIGIVWFGVSWLFVGGDMDRFERCLLLSDPLIGLLDKLSKAWGIR